MSYCMWGLAASFYLYQFILRVSSSVLIPSLRETFHLDASGVAFLSSLALYTYSSLQIPAGFLADFFGARKTLLASTLLCLIGNILFAFAESVFIAQVSRLLIGAGSAASFLCVSKVVTAWFPPSKQSFLFGMTMTAGTFGALNGSVPLAALVDWLGWRDALLLVSGIGGLILGALFFFFQEKRGVKSTSTSFESPSSPSGWKLGKSFVGFLQHSTGWIYAFCAFGSYLGVNLIADLWGPSFLMKAYSISLQEASRSTSFLYLGLCVGSLVLTALGNTPLKRTRLIQLSLAMLAILTSLFLWIPFSLAGVEVLLFCLGFFSGSCMLCFSGAVEGISPHIGGMVIGFINSVVMLLGALGQQAVGKFLDYFWLQEAMHTPLLNTEFRVYELHHYQAALTFLPVSIGVTALLAWGLSRRHASS